MRLKNNSIASLFTLEKVYFFIVFLFAARATYLTWQPDPRINPLGFFLLLIPTLFILKKYKIQLFNAKLNPIYLILFIWITCQCALTGSHLPIMEIMVLFQFIVAYTVVRVYGLKFISYFESIVVVLTFIDVILWVLMQFIGVENMSSLGFMIPANSVSEASFLIFNVPNRIFEENLNSAITRNCGFCWEPGLFASFLVIAIYFNLQRCKYIKNNYALYILIIGLLTSQSTTGYSALILLIINYYVIQKNNKSHKIIALIVVIPIFIWMMSLSFMGNKIGHTLLSENYLMNNDQSIIYLENNDKYIVVQRFEGLYLDFLNFIYDPIIGYGYRDNSYVARNISSYLSISNGIVSLFAKWGIIIGFLVFIYYYKSAKYFDMIFKQKKRMLFVIFCVISISYSFNFLALFMAIMFYPYFCDNKKLYNYE